MITTRKVVALFVLALFSITLTAVANNLAGTVFDFANNLYLAGLATLVASLSFHVLVVRRFLSADRLFSQLLGIAFSGVFSIVIYDSFQTFAAHLTLVQRQGSHRNWGDEGISSGLPVWNEHFDVDRFVSHVPRTLEAAAVYGVVWFPFLSLLDRWTYRLPCNPSQLKDK